MMKTNWKSTLKNLIVPILVILFLTACGEVGPLQTVTETVPLEGASRAAVTLEMGAGNLNVAGGAEELAVGEFTFNVEEWEPTLDRVVAGDAVELEVSQPALETLGTPDGAENVWDLQLNERVPLALAIRLGAGQSDLDLATLNLRELDLSTGASGVNLNLAGDWTEDLDAQIRGGVGELTVYLPDDVGVRVNVDQVLGDLNAEELNETGDYLVNDSYGETEATLNLDIKSGVGTITLEIAE